MKIIKVTFAAIILGAIIFGGCAQNAPRVNIPEAPAAAPEEKPAEKFNYTNRKIISDIDDKEFRELYSSKGKPKFLVIANRELGEENPAELRMRGIIEVKKESIGEAKKEEGGQAPPSASGNQQNVTVIVGGGGAPDDRDTKTTLSVRARDKGILETLSDSQVEASIGKTLRKYKISVTDLDTANLAACREAARTDSGGADRCTIELVKLVDYADILVLTKYFGAGGVLRYSIKAVNLNDGRILAYEADTETEDRYGKPFTLTNINKFFEQRAQRMVRDIAEFWKENKETKETAK